jgi:hypothetical protein
MGNLLPEGYDKIPSTGKYIKLLDGRNVFRILLQRDTGLGLLEHGGQGRRRRPRGQSGFIAATFHSSKNE